MVDRVLNTLTIFVRLFIIYRMYARLFQEDSKESSFSNDTLPKGSMSLKGLMQTNSINPFHTASETPVTSQSFKLAASPTTEVTW